VSDFYRSSRRASGIYAGGLYGMPLPARSLHSPADRRAPDRKGFDLGSRHLLRGLPVSTPALDSSTWVLCLRSRVPYRCRLAYDYHSYLSLITPRLTLPSSPTVTVCLGCTCPGCYLRLPHGMTLLPVRQLAGVLARCQRLNLRHGCPCFVSTRLLFITGYHPRSPICSRQVTDPPERVGWQVLRFALCDSRTMWKRLQTGGYEVPVRGHLLSSLRWPPPFLSPAMRFGCQGACYPPTNTV
jgi:hypothetical protein